MLKLPNVTLIALSGLGYKTSENIAALNKSCEGIEFGVVKYIQLKKIVDIESWNSAVISELPKYVETSHCLFIHGDGYVIHPELWQDEWLKYDWCSSPWPLPKDDYSYRTPTGRLIRVGNSVSLRSKRLMDLAAIDKMEYHFGNNNEDGEICVWQRDFLEQHGCIFMPFEEAIHFGKEASMPENEGVETFLFHRYD